jgi:ribosomal protein S18 acetylase RimI-like enzyme
MNTTHRSHTEAQQDFGRLVQFVTAHNQAVRRYSTWCLGRLVDWRYHNTEGKQPIEQYCADNAILWFDGFGDLAAFAIAENGGAECAIITTAGYRFLFAEMLEVALDAWGSRDPRFTIEVTAAQELEIAALERAGFRCHWPFYTYTYDLTLELPDRSQLEEGFTIVDMGSRPDYRAQRFLRSSGFHDINELSEEEIARDLESQALYCRGPIYHAPTDICVMAPNGTFVAGCEALIDARNREADIERVCTHNAYRRRGFARAAIHDCLYRLKEMGLQRARITGYSQAAVALYASFGGVESVNYIYEKVEGV